MCIDASKSQVYRVDSSPVVVGDGAVLVAWIGATVAAATGVTVLKMGFYNRGKKEVWLSLCFVFSKNISKRIGQNDFNLCNRVRNGFLSSNGRVGGQGDPCGRVTWGWRALNTQGRLGWVDRHSWTTRIQKDKIIFYSSTAINSVHVFDLNLMHLTRVPFLQSGQPLWWWPEIEVWWQSLEPLL